MNGLDFEKGQNHCNIMGLLERGGGRVSDGRWKILKKETAVNVEKIPLEFLNRR
jgi:hypothetical protein